MKPKNKRWVRHNAALWLLFWQSLTLDLFPDLEVNFSWEDFLSFTKCYVWSWKNLQPDRKRTSSRNFLPFFLCCRAFLVSFYPSGSVFEVPFLFSIGIHRNNPTISQVSVPNRSAHVFSSVPNKAVEMMPFFSTQGTAVAHTCPVGQIKECVAGKYRSKK